MSDKFFDDGGAIDTDDDNSGAVPVMPAAQTPDDNSGAAPVMGTNPPDQGSSGGDQSNPTRDAITNFPKNVKAIVSYLMGQGAAPPEAIDGAAQQVDPSGQMSADDRNILAVEQANQKGGPQAAWALVQANRVAYNAKTAFAATALAGIDGKPADIAASARAATQASQHILDGSSTVFTPNQQGGVTATVKMPSGQPQQINLSPAQFNQWLQVGGDGQWDKVMENGGVPATLQRISQGQGIPIQPQTANARVGAPARPQAQARPAPAPAQSPGQVQGQGQDQDEGSEQPVTSYGRTPSTLNLSGSDEPARGTSAAEETGYGREMEARAMRLFPWASQEAQRNQWMAAQENQEEERKNKIDVAGETGKQRIKVAEATGRGRVETARVTGDSRLESQRVRSEGNKDVAKLQTDARLEGLKQKAIQFAQKQEQTAQDNASRERARNFRALLTNPNFVLQKPEDIQAAAQKAGINLGVGTAPAAPTQPQAQHNVPPVEQRVLNQVYTTPKGQFKWMGNGWQPVQ